MADDKKTATPPAVGLEAVVLQLAANQAELTKAIARLAERDAGEATVDRDAAPVKVPLDSKYLGTKTYQLGAPHYRNGKYYEVGDTITVTDEKPSKTWTLVGGVDLSDESPRNAAPSKKIPGRPADADL